MNVIRGINSRPPTAAHRFERPKTRGPGSRPKTAASALGVSDASQQIVCALTESRGVVAQVGLAFINISSGECVLSEICDSQTYVRTLHKLAVFDPLEILVPETLIQAKASKLPIIIAENLPGAQLTTLPRKYYNEKVGMDYISRFSFRSETEAVQVAISGKFYAISAAAAAFKHIELRYNVGFVGHSIRIKYQSSEGSMVIDFSTVQNLELIQNLRNPKSGDCLFGLLNNTVTPMGSRLLRSSILQPLTDVGILEDRLDAVEELVSNEQTLLATKKALQAFGDMDRLLTSLITVPANSSIKFSEKSINDIILLKKVLASMIPIHEALAGSQSKLLLAVRSLCSFEKVQAVQDLIDEVISPDAIWAATPLDLRHQRCYAVKSGFNGLLDVARQTYKEATEDLITVYQELSRDHNLPALEVKWESQRGYYLRIPTADVEETPLPPKFVNIVKKRKYIECNTLEIMKRNARVGDAMTEVLLMSDRAVQQLIDDIRAEMSSLYKVCEGLGMLDMITSFATLASIYEYVRPEFKDTLAIKDGRHPIREKIHKEKLIPNDTYASQQSRFQIITALMTIMAQIGSFVPATYAAFPIITNLFARVSMDDNIKANVSTFAAEMRETAFILKNATEGGMVIIDELGRGTCIRDGLAIAIATCEALIQKRAFVWFATHFRELGAVLGRKAGVVSLHMQVDIRENRNITAMLYKIADGPAKEKHYGINLARIVGLPDSIIERASEVSTIIATNAEQRKSISKGYVKAERQKLILQLHERLQQARSSRMTDQSLRNWLLNLQNNFIEQMSQLEDLDDDEDDEYENEINEVMTVTTSTDLTTSDETIEKITSNEHSYSFEGIASPRDDTPILIASQDENEDVEMIPGPPTSWNGFTTSDSLRNGNSDQTYTTSDATEMYYGSLGTGDGQSSETLQSLELQGIYDLSDVEDQI